jgi:hypothetical protein
VVQVERRRRRVSSDMKMKTIMMMGKQTCIKLEKINYIILYYIAIVNCKMKLRDKIALNEIKLNRTILNRKK